MTRQLIAIALTVALFHLLSASPSVYFVKDSLTLDLTKSADDADNIREWIVETREDRIFYLTIQSASGEPLDKTIVESILTIRDGRDNDASILFPESSSTQSSNNLPIYSTGNSVLIRVNYKFLSNVASQTLQLKIEKAVSCPVSLPGPSSCGRIVDALSCYCATFSNRNWADTKTYCRDNGMQFLALESYEEDLAVWSTWGGTQLFWIGAIDTTSEGTFIWDASGKPMSPGYTNWGPGNPSNTNNEDCVHYYFGFPMGTWNDCNCNASSTTNPGCFPGFTDQNIGGICELLP